MSSCSNQAGGEAGADGVSLEELLLKELLCGQAVAAEDVTKEALALSQKLV